MMDFAKIGAMAEAAGEIPIEIQKGFAQVIAQQQTIIELLRLNAYLLAAIWAKDGYLAEDAGEKQEAIYEDAVNFAKRGGKW